MKAPGKNKKIKKFQMEVSRWSDKEFTQHSYTDFGFHIMEFRSEDDSLLALIRRYRKYDEEHPFPFEYTLLDKELNIIGVSHDVNEIMRDKNIYLDYLENKQQLQLLRKRNIQLKIVR